MVLTNCEWRLKEMVREEQAKVARLEELNASILAERNRVAHELAALRESMACPECKERQAAHKAWLKEVA